MNDPVMQKDPSLDAISPDSSSPASSRSLLVYFVFALGFALFVRFFIAAPYLVDGASMDQTFHNGNYLIVDRVSYKLGEPMRGDVIVFGLPGNEKKSLIKRIIGLPNETVILRGDKVTIKNEEHPNGFTLDEPYLDPANLDGQNNLEITLEPDQYFVMGDNRHVSSDSRIWGPLPGENIAGRVFLRLYPFDRVGVLPGVARYSEE